MLISIIVPVYNISKYIKRCLDSLMANVAFDYEVIMVDDGSTDDCPQIIDAYAEKNPFFKSFHKTNGGLSDARNYGLTKAKGDYVWFVDGDDYIANDALLNISQAILENQPEILCFTSTAISHNKKRIIRFEHVKDLTDGKTFLKIQYKKRSMCPEIWHNVYKKAFLHDNFLTFKKGIYHEDEEFSPRAFILAKRIVTYSFNAYFYDAREGSIMSQLDYSKHFTDLGQILLEYKDSSLFSKDLKALITDRLASLYVSAFIKNKSGFILESDIIGYSVLKCCCKTIKTKIKVFLFFNNRKLLFRLSKVFR